MDTGKNPLQVGEVSDITAGARPPTEKTGPPADGKNTDLEAKLEYGPKQLRDLPGKTNAGTLLDYYKPKGVDPRLTQSQLPDSKPEIPVEISSTLPLTDGGSSELRSEREQESAHSESLPPNYNLGRSPTMVGSPTHSAPSGQDHESLMTPSPDQNSRIRIKKGGQMAPNTGGLPARVPTLLDLNIGQRHTGSTAPPQGTIGEQGGPRPEESHRWVDQTTSLVELISRVEDRHRVSFSGWD